MIHRVKLILPALLLCLSLAAKERTDTLDFGRSSVYITYNVKPTSDEVVVDFTNVELRNCNNFGCNPEDLAVMLFYNRSGYDIEFRGKADREPISISGNVELNVPRGNKGYLMLNDERNQASLTFKLSDSEGGVLTVPIYLALYVKEKGVKLLKKAKTYYEIREDWLCGRLVIPLKMKQTAAMSSEPTTRQWTETVTEEQEIESADNVSILDSLKSIMSGGPSPDEQRRMEMEENMKKAMRLMDDIKKELSQTTELPFSSTLSANKDMLTSLKNDFDNDSFRNQIQEVLDSCTSKEKALQAAEQEKSKKKTIWMVIGGFLLAILTFVGNSLFQHFKNVRNNRSMMEMAENMERRAIADAERRAKGMARSKISREVNGVRQKTREAIRNKTKDVVKGKDNNKPKGNNNNGNKYTI